MPTIRLRPDVEVTIDVFRKLRVSIENLEELPDDRSSFLSVCDVNSSV